MSFLLYLEHHEIDVDALPQEVIVELMIDNDTEMAYVTIAGKSVHYGNFWDFHDGCIEHPDIGEFNSMNELIELIEIGLNDLGHAVEIVEGVFDYYA